MNYTEKIRKAKWNMPVRIISKIKRIIIKKFEFYQISSDFQNNKMKEEGFDREKGLAKLNGVLNKLFGKAYDENDGMFSEHLVLLAAISVGYQIKNILEIGTFDGRTALILSYLFPESKITTIDLPSQDQAFSGSYGRENQVESFTKKRNENLDKAKNVVFREMNSIALVNSNDNYDLIWIDGAHGYPVVAMDIINAYRNCKEEGIILIDDIWTDVNVSDKLYKSSGGYESLNVLLDANLIKKFLLFHKRLGGIYNYPEAKKYVGMFRKKSWQMTKS